jgi:hypothetical protein
VVPADLLRCRPGRDLADHLGVRLEGDVGSPHARGHHRSLVEVVVGEGDRRVALHALGPRRGGRVEPRGSQAVGAEDRVAVVALLAEQRHAELGVLLQGDPGLRAVRALAHARRSYSR